MGSRNVVDAGLGIVSAGLAGVTGGASLGILPVKKKIDASKDAAAQAASDADAARAQAAANVTQINNKRSAKAAVLESMYKPVGNVNTFGTSGRATLLGN